MSTERVKDWLRLWEDCQCKRGLRRSRPRQIVVETFLESDSHVSVDELYRAVGERDQTVGYATVYRTIRLLQDCGLAIERRFGAGSAARFEPAGTLKKEHSHFVCCGCGAVVEFPCDEVPPQLAAAAAEHGFQVRRCTVEAGGRCARCLAEEAKAEEAKAEE